MTGGTRRRQHVKERAPSGEDNDNDTSANTVEPLTNSLSERWKRRESRSGHPRRLRRYRPQGLLHRGHKPRVGRKGRAPAGAEDESGLCVRMEVRTRAVKAWRRLAGEEQPLDRPTDPPGMTCRRRQCMPLADTGGRRRWRTTSATDNGSRGPNKIDQDRRRPTKTGDKDRQRYGR